MHYTVFRGALKRNFNNSSSPEAAEEQASCAASSSPDQWSGFHLFHLLGCPAFSLCRPCVQWTHRYRCQRLLWHGTTQVSRIRLHEVEWISCWKLKGRIL